MILNENLTAGELPADVQRAFTGGQPRKIQLQSGHQLFKFTQYALFGSSGEVTPWWSSVNPVTPSDSGLEMLLVRAARNGTTPADFARARNAVTNQWNSMSGLLIAKLRQPVYAFVGRVSGQRYDTRPAFRNVLFIGGAIQLWIPNLNFAQIGAV